MTQAVDGYDRPTGTYESWAVSNARVKQCNKPDCNCAECNCDKAMWWPEEHTCECACCQ